MKNLLYSLIIILALASCQDMDQTNEPLEPSPEITVKVPKALLEYQHAGSRITTSEGLKEALNATLFANTHIQVKEIDIYSSYDAATDVETVDTQFESTLSSRWVPGDPNRNWNGDDDLENIDWVSFSPFALANGIYDAEPIYRAMYNKWENDGYCNTVNIDETIYDFSMGSPSLILDLGLPSTGFPIADVSVIGFLPGEIFESVLGSENILGVAFSFVFVDDNGDPVKTTRGKDDKAYAEVWYNDSFTWSDGTLPGIDMESVILHEFGHTLNLGHFGILQRFTDTETGESQLVYQPVNTMNALYIGEPRNFLGPNDKGNFCESWGSWPWN